MQAHMSRTELEQRIRGLPSLPLPLQVAPVLARLLVAGETPVEDFVAVCELVPSLAARLFQADARWAVGQTPTVALGDVAAHLGRRTVRATLAAALEELRQAVGLASGDPEAWQSEQVVERARDPTETLRTSLWFHGMATGLAAGLLAEAHGVLPPGWARLAGLLHDMGKTALLAVDASTCRRLRDTALARRLPFVEVERQFGLPGHELLGHLLGSRWGFPTHLRNIIYYHHECEPRRRDLTDIQMATLLDLVIVGNSVSRRLRLGDPLDSMGSPAWGAYTRERLGLSRADLRHVAHKLEARYQEALDRILGPAAPGASARTGKRAAQPDGEQPRSSLGPWSSLSPPEDL